MTTYSAFFSSGLLAPHHTYYSGNLLPSTPRSHSRDTAPPSPAAPSSPLPVPDDSDIEIDEIEQAKQSGSADAFPVYVISGRTTEGGPATRPRLKKRRSSLGVATSPVSAIKTSKSPLRARSGSLGFSLGFNGDVFGLSGKRNMGATVASEGTSLVGRMRSGSGTLAAGIRLRKLMRRTASSPVPAPAPPPTAPLPALPILDGRTPLNYSSSHNGTAHRPTLSRKSTTLTEPIDEVMKEN